MLVTEEFFATFTNRPVADARTSTEVAVALLFENRERVDQIVDDAVAQGAWPSWPC